MKTTMTIWREFRFAASHRLPNLPESHKCHRLHGHNYLVRVELRGELDPTLGWVEDYGFIKVKVDALIQQLDHQHLNDIPGLENPTAEVLCQWLGRRIALAEPKVSAIEVQENEHSGARLEVSR